MSRGLSSKTETPTWSCDQLARQEPKLKPEFLRNLVLPLLNETTRGDDQASVKIAPEHHLLDVQATHDGLAGTWVISE